MEFVNTKTEDNLILQGLISESNDKTDSVVLHIHGMAGNFWENNFIKTMLREYPKNGISFLTVETRGAELLRWFSTPDNKNKLIGDSYEIFEESIFDIDAWVKFLEERGYKNIHLQGHSLGCSKIAYYQKEKENNLIKSLTFISPSDMMGLLVNEKDKPDYDRFLKEAKELSEAGKENELLSGIQWDFAKQSAKSFINFSFKNDNLAIFNYYNPERGFETIKSIKIPMLSILGTKDDGIVTDAYKSNEILEKNALNCPKFRSVVFEGAQHSFDGFEDKIVEEVISFVRKRE